MAKAERKLQRSREKTVVEEVEEESIKDQLGDLFRLVGPVILLGLLLLAGLFMLNKFKNSRSSTDIRVAEELRSAPPDKVLELIKANPDSPEAPNQLMRSAKDAYNKGNFSSAMDIYQQVATDYSEYPLADAAGLNVAICLEGAQKIKEAKASYEAWIEKHPDNLRVNAAKVGLARCFLQGTPDAAEAKRRFEAILETEPEEALKEHIESYIKDADRLLGS